MEVFYFDFEFFSMVTTKIPFYLFSSLFLLDWGGLIPGFLLSGG